MFRIVTSFLKLILVIFKSHQIFNDFALIAHAVRFFSALVWSTGTVYGKYGIMNFLQLDVVVKHLIFITAEPVLIIILTPELDLRP